MFMHTHIYIYVYVAYRHYKCNEFRVFYDANIKTSSLVKFIWYSKLSFYLLQLNVLNKDYVESSISFIV